MTTFTEPTRLAAAPGRPLSRRRAWINFIIFAVVTAGGGWLFVAMDRAAGAVGGTGSATSAAGTSGQGLWILVPAVVSVALFFLSRDGAGRLGLTVRFDWRWIIVAVVLFPLMAAVVILTGLAAGGLTWQSAASPGGQSIGVALLAMLPFLLVKNFFEEFIFRGYGTRTAMALGLPGILPHVAVGVVWALWHLPLYAVWMPVADFQQMTSLAWPLFLPLFLVGIVVDAVVYGEIRVRTGSIWPLVVLHTVSNALATVLLLDGYLRFVGRGDVLFSLTPQAVVMMLVTAAVGLLLYRRRVTVERAQPR